MSSFGKNKYICDDGTPTAVYARSLPITLTGGGVIDMSASYYKITASAASQPSSIIQANGFSVGAKKGQILNITLTAVTNSGTSVIVPTASAPISQGTSNTIVAPGFANGCASITLAAAGNYVTLLYLGDNKFIVIDFSGAAFA